MSGLYIKTPQVVADQLGVTIGKENHFGESNLTFNYSQMISNVVSYRFQLQLWEHYMFLCLYFYVYMFKLYSKKLVVDKQNSHRSVCKVYMLQCDLPDYVEYTSPTRLVEEFSDEFCGTNFTIKSI